MRRLAAAAILVLHATPPALAVSATATSVTCAAAVTTGLGGDQQMRDLDASDLPVLAYKAMPGAGEFKQLTKLGDVPVRLFVYRVNAQLLHLQIFEPQGEGKGVLADTPLAGDMTELTWRSMGSDEMVTVYCY